MQGPESGRPAQRAAGATRPRVILANDEGARREAVAALRRTCHQQSYGEATARLLPSSRGAAPAAQRRSGRPPAAAVNKLLRELGLLDQERPPAFRLVMGFVHREDGLPLRGARVRATHVSERRREIRLGDDSRDAEGRYTIRYDALPGVDAVNLSCLRSVKTADDRSVRIGSGWRSPLRPSTSRVPSRRSCWRIVRRSRSHPARARSAGREAQAASLPERVRRPGDFSEEPTPSAMAVCVRLRRQESGSQPGSACGHEARHARRGRGCSLGR